MKIKILTPVVDYRGENVKQTDERGIKKKNDKGEEVELTWRDVAFEALNGFTKDEQPTSETRQQCYQLTNKIFSNDEIDLTVVQMAFILDRVDKVYMYSPMICGRSKEFFELKEK